MGDINKHVLDEHLRSRLLARAHIVPETGCMEFAGCIQGNGYGRMTFRRHVDYVHRWAYVAFRGLIFAGLDVCHSCDNRPCMNIEHLFLGSRLDNMTDARAKGRLSAGEKHGATISGEKAGLAKLTLQSVIAIRRLTSNGIEPRVIADAFGVGCSNIQKIVSGRTWKTLGE